MGHIMNDAELKELHNEYHAISDRIRDLQARQAEIDSLINANSCEAVASRFIPLGDGDKVRITLSTFTGLNKPDLVTHHEGFFGGFHLAGHQYTEDYGEHRVFLRLYRVRKDGTPSARCDDYLASRVTDIEKMTDKTGDGDE